MHAKIFFFFWNDNRVINRPFKLDHVWQILKDCLKWNDQNQAPTPTPKDSSHSGHTVNLEEDDDDVVMPTPRQLGRDKQKVAKIKGKVLKGISTKVENSCLSWFNKEMS